jgi:hypothetical protein
MSILLHKLSREELIESLLEVTVTNSDDFLKIKETLERMGIANRKTNTLYQSCHILHKRGKYYIVHFKELFALDGREVDISDEDLARRNGIAYLLQEWNLCKPVIEMQNDMVKQLSLAVISFKDKADWTLLPKYKIGSV